MKKIVALAATTALSLPAVALDRMPEKSGFSGFFNIGVGVGALESNFVAKLKGFDVDLSDETIQDFGSPDDEDLITPALNINVNYTFSNLKTQVSIGNDLSDFLQFDRSTVASVRHDFDTLGRVQLSFVSTPYLATEVWEDPYILNAKRNGTERTSDGGRFTWDKIFGSQFELKIESRAIDLDEERSGEALGLSESERALLDREGDSNTVELGYLFILDEGANVARPSFTYIDQDLDGKAMAQEGYKLGFSWLHTNPSISWVNNLNYTIWNGDERNPIFGERNDATTYAIASQMFFKNAFGMKHWQPNVSVLYAKTDGDIEFNDSAGWLVSVAIGRTF
ncbi:MAG: DUF2860 family protein [Pseudomonadota bacterium]